MLTHRHVELFGEMQQHLTARMGAAGFDETHGQLDLATQTVQKMRPPFGEIGDARREPLWMQWRICAVGGSGLCADLPGAAADQPPLDSRIKTSAGGTAISCSTLGGLPERQAKKCAEGGAAVWLHSARSMTYPSERKSPLIPAQALWHSSSVEPGSLRQKPRTNGAGLGWSGPTDGEVWSARNRFGGDGA
jgi:hypothetical protein